MGRRKARSRESRWRASQELRDVWVLERHTSYGRQHAMGMVVMMVAAMMERKTH
jgi:hypothetical protein